MSNEQEKTKLWKTYGILMSVMLGGTVIVLVAQSAWNAIQQNLAKSAVESKPLSTDSSPSNTSSIAPTPLTELPSSTAQSPLTVRSQPTTSPLSVETQRVSFEKGSTGATIHDSVTANQLRRYLLQCGSGQRMIVQVPDGNVNLAVIAPDGKTIGTAMNGTTQWQGQLPSDGDYVIEVSAPDQSYYTVNVEVL